MSEITIPMIPYHRLPLIAVLVVCYTLAWETGRLIKQLKQGKQDLDTLHNLAYGRLCNGLTPEQAKVVAELRALPEVEPERELPPALQPHQGDDT